MILGWVGKDRGVRRMVCVAGREEISRGVLEGLQFQEIGAPDRA